jgi:polar amino acid transport system substrate-binding protein
MLIQMGVDAGQSYLFSRPLPDRDIIEKYAFAQGHIPKPTVDQVDLLMKDAALKYSIEMMPRARALALAETQDMTCIFTTVHNQARDKHFKWVEPLRVDRTILVRRSGSSVNPGTLAEATKFVIGTQRGDFTADLLKEKIFLKVDLASDFNLSLKKPLAGRIDLMPAPRNVATS